MSSVTLAHAVCDENGKSRGGKPGDQTTKEVRLQGWYKSGSGWDMVLRCKNKALREMIADNAEAGARNPHLGYNQDKRYEAFYAVKNQNFDLRKLNVDADCDCSSLATVCANYAGIPIPKDTYTGNMKARYSASGCFKILTAKKYTDSIEKLVRGDILVREGHHTAIVINTVYWLKSSIKQSSATLDRVNDVKAIQSRLNALKGTNYLEVDGIWGNKTDAAVREFQRINNLDIDGIVGKNTALALGFVYGG